MDQKIGDTEYRIILIITDIHVYNAAILLNDNTMKCHRKGNPLILLHTTIVMRIKKSKIRILIERVLLQVHARAVDVRTQNVDPFLKSLRTDDKESDCLLVIGAIYLVTSLELLALPDQFF